MMPMDAVILIIVGILALAMITERVVEIFKKILLPLIGQTLSRKQGTAIQSGLWGMLASFNIRLEYEPIYEQRREQWIIALNFLTGQSIAACSWFWVGALIENQSRLQINPVPGIFYTGVLLSFSAKIWHDLLDLVLIIKNTRRNYNITTSANFILTEEGKAMAEAVIHEEKDKLFAQYGSALVELTPLLIRDPHKCDGFRYVVGAYFQDKRPGGFPDYFRIPGTNHWIKVQPIEEIGLPKAQSYPGSFLRNPGSGRHGSYGCLVQCKKGKRYILTCAHVLSDNPGSVNTPETLNQIQVWVSGTNEVLPVYKYQFAGAAGTDFALIGPVDERYTNNIGKTDRLCNNRKVSAADEGTVVTASLSRYAFVCEYSSILKKHHIQKQDVVFQDGSVHTLHNLIRLDKISREGDSGAMIYNSSRQVMGMIVASDLVFTYALKIESIFNELQGFEMA